MIWTPLEIAANLMTAVCIFLACRNSVHTWWTGIVACLLFGWLFFGANLYADVTLQLFFIVTGIIGWYKWSKSTDGTTAVPISYSNRASLFRMLVIASTVAGIYGLILFVYTDAYMPVIDSFVLTFSIVAQLLLMNRKVENWPVWVLVNAVSVPLYFSRELYLTAGLYSLFFIHAIWAWRVWIIKAREVQS